MAGAALGVSKDVKVGISEPSDVCMFHLIAYSIEISTAQLCK